MFWIFQGRKLFKQALYTPILLDVCREQGKEMPDIAAVFKQEISCLARKEVRSLVLGLRKAVREHRRAWPR